MADPTNVLAVDDLKRRAQMEIVPMIATERAVSDALSGVHSAGTQMSEVLKQVSEEAAGDVEVQQPSATRSISTGSRSTAKTRP